MSTAVEDNMTPSYCHFKLSVALVLLHLVCFWISNIS